MLRLVIRETQQVFANFMQQAPGRSHRQRPPHTCPPVLEGARGSMMVTRSHKKLNKTQLIYLSIYLLIL